jgi:hypothetical protein
MSESEFSKERVPLGDVQPVGSRGMWQRSAMALVDGRAIVGTDGRIRAVPTASDGEKEWAVETDDEYVVSLAAGPNGAITAGGRGENGTITAINADGTVRWRYRTVEDLGSAQKNSLFFLPYVVAIVTDGERIYVAARRYERDGEDRVFRSVVYAFSSNGELAWSYRADASPIALDSRGERLAIAYNRCSGDHQCGLVVLETSSGNERLTWDPGTNGDRRVGDVSLLAEGVAVASHGDYRGYCLDKSGSERWSVDLACPIEVGEETLYAYPNHACATGEGIVFVTGNTYPEEGREAEGRHPREYTISSYDFDGSERWHASLSGWASELAANGETVAVPCAQHFRDRDPATHGVRLFDLADGPATEYATEGIVTAVALNDEHVVAIEEPVEYHDGDAVHGEYRLHRFAHDNFRS